MAGRRLVIGQALRFGVTGVFNTLVDVALFMLLVHVMNTAPALANVVSYSVGILSSFALNSSWTFKAGFGPGTAQRLAVFVGVNLTALALSTGIVAVAAPFTSPLIAKLISLPVTYLWNFVLSRKLVFRAAPPPG